MRILVHREAGAGLAREPDEGAVDRLLFAGLGIGFRERADDQRADGRAGTLGAAAQQIVEGFGNVDGGADCHDVGMVQMP